MLQSPQSRMSVAPTTNANHSGINKTTHVTNAKKSFIQRACSSPSIVSLYQEPFKEPSGIIADNISGTQNPPGIHSESLDLHGSSQPMHSVNQNLMSKEGNLSQEYRTNMSIQNGNTETGKYDLKQMITKLSKNDIEQLVGKISKHMSNESLGRCSSENQAEPKYLKQTWSGASSINKMQSDEGKSLESSAVPNEIKEMATAIDPNHVGVSSENQINQKSVIEHLDNNVTSTPMDFQEMESKSTKNNLSVPNLYAANEYKSSSSETPETGESNLSSPFDNYQFWNCEIVNVTTVKSVTEDCSNLEKVTCGINKEKTNVGLENQESNTPSSDIGIIDNTSPDSISTDTYNNKDDKYLDDVQHGHLINESDNGCEKMSSPGPVDASLKPICQADEKLSTDMYSSSKFEVDTEYIDKPQSSFDETCIKEHAIVATKSGDENVPSYPTNEDYASNEEAMDCTDTEDSCTHSQQQSDSTSDYIFPSPSFSNFNAVKIKRWSEFSAEWNEANRPPQKTTREIKHEPVEVSVIEPQTDLVVPETVVDLNEINKVAPFDIEMKTPELKVPEQHETERSKQVEVEQEINKADEEATEIIRKDTIYNMHEVEGHLSKSTKYAIFDHTKSMIEETDSLPNDNFQESFQEPNILIIDSMNALKECKSVDTFYLEKESEKQVANELDLNLYKPVEWSKHYYNVETNPDNNVTEASVTLYEDRDQQVSLYASMISDANEEFKEIIVTCEIEQENDNYNPDSVSVKSSEETILSDKNQDKYNDEKISPISTERHYCNVIAQNCQQLVIENQGILENEKCEAHSDIYTSPFGPQITPTSGYITEDSDQNAMVSQTGVTSSLDDQCLPDIYTITPLSYDRVASSAANSVFESEDCNSICDEIINTKEVNVLNAQKESLNFCKSPSTPLPSAQSVLDISSFRLESPTVQDDEEDGSNMPDLGEPYSPPTMSKFPSHIPYPARPSFPPPRLDMFPDTNVQTFNYANEPTKNEIKINVDKDELMPTEEPKLEESECIKVVKVDEGRSPEDVTQNLENNEDIKHLERKQCDNEIDASNGQEQDNGVTSIDEWRSIPIQIESSEEILRRLQNPGYNSSSSNRNSYIEEPSSSLHVDVPQALPKSKSFVIIEELSDESLKDTSEHKRVGVTSDIVGDAIDEVAILDTPSQQQLEYKDNDENKTGDDDIKSSSPSRNIDVIHEPGDKPTNCMTSEQNEGISVINTVYEIYESKREDEEADSEEKFDTCSEASHATTDMDISFGSTKSPKQLRNKQINNLLSMKARISPVIRNIPIHYGDDTLQSDMGESSSSDSESEDEYEAMRLRRANMRNDRDRTERAPERDILEDDTETAEFQTRLRKLSSSSSVSAQLNCSGSALPELSRPAKSASGDLIEEEEEDEEMFADTTDQEMKEMSVDVSVIEEPSIIPHCPKPSHSPPVLVSQICKQESSSALEPNLAIKNVNNVTQSEEEALDKVTNTDMKLSPMKPDDERPHSVAVVTADSEGIVERFNSTYLLPETKRDVDAQQDKAKEPHDAEEAETMEDEEDDEFLKLRSHLIALRHSRSFDSGLSISKLYQQALLANNKELRKGKYFYK